MTYIHGLTGVEIALTRIAAAMERIAKTQEAAMPPKPTSKQLLVDQAALAKIVAEAKIDTEHD
jgi:hypothetical protein